MTKTLLEIMLKDYCFSKALKMGFIFLISLLFCSQKANCATWTDPGNYDTSWYNDLSNSFDIYTPEQFAGFIFLSNNNTSFEGKTLNLRADLDMGKYDWIPCEKVECEISGHGYKLSNINYNYSGDRTSMCSIFKSINSNGNIHHISFVNLSLNVLLTTYGNSLASLVGENYGKLNNCRIDGEVKLKMKGPHDYSYYIGGLAAKNSGNLSSCCNNARISIQCYDSYGYYKIYAGGIVGYNDGSINNCLNYGEVYSIFSYDYTTRSAPSSWVGGICGYSNVKVENDINFGNVISAQTYTRDHPREAAFADGICPTVYCPKSYFSSSINIEGSEVKKNGTMLSIEQMRNQTLDFTSLLNENVESIDFSPKTYWANSPGYNNNEPFLLNSLNLDLRCAYISQSTINVECLPLKLESSWIVEKGFEYQKRGSNIIHTVSVNDTFSAEFIDLETETIYDIRAFVKGKTGIVYSKNIEVKTSAPLIQTLDPTEITPVSAILNGKIEVGNTPIKSQGFLWKKQGGNYSVVLTQGSEYSVKIDKLIPSTTYIYQAYAIDELDNSIYGNEVSFKTSPITVVIDKKESTPNSIELTGRINLNIATDIVAEYRELNSGTFANKKVLSQSNGQFSATIDNLLSDTEYEIRAYFIYEKSTIYSPTEIISTMPLEISTLTPYVDKYVEFYGVVTGNFQAGEFGFEYREINVPDIIPSKNIISSITENKFVGRPSNVENGINYKVRAYYRSPSNKYSYGQWVEFLPTNLAAVEDIEVDKGDEIIAIYNIQGQRVNAITKGINFIRLSNGNIIKVVY